MGNDDGIRIVKSSLSRLKSEKNKIRKIFLPDSIIKIGNTYYKLLSINVDNDEPYAICISPLDCLAELKFPLSRISEITKPDTELRLFKTAEKFPIGTVVSFDTPFGGTKIGEVIDVYVQPSRKEVLLRLAVLSSTGYFNTTTEKVKPFKLEK